MKFLDFNSEGTDNPKEEKFFSDEEVLHRSVKNPKFFEVLIERYEEAFLRKAGRILRGKEDSEDAVQETFTKIYLSAHKFQKQEGASFSSWGYKILQNTCFTHYQKLKRKRGATLELSDEMVKYIEDPASAGFLEKKEASDYVASIMTKMPKALNRILHLHFIERRPQKEIARMEGLSLGAVKTRIYRAKKEFQKVSDYNLV
ncbi:hypothetical protein COW82_02220 [Candidatus Campbellbacteria bacterium CG22_combo_CG10-13_8_21_14_all_43_18]|uniref:RNA polymerase sigma factor n=1 Tax=Candidatus Campbellbacteria bacterium CG22_combo_CG10-13_8_21_14_all_43_18 TaxID=1974530 RepID=A0A2H0DXT0_9BACT|nr:MAG: hypothetical protein COW82_02220 [Candidatus Campbellbacteria bacterium CG22_combo_CG10-13_8_21_14_all_43_18]